MEVALKARNEEDAISEVLIIYNDKARQLSVVRVSVPDFHLI